MDTGLSGKGVLVTGAGGGIGAACAHAFAAEGARVVVHYRSSRDVAEAVAREIGSGEPVQADLTVEGDVDRLFDVARAQVGSVEVCAAVAGVWPTADEPVWQMSLARWRETLDANLTSVFLTARGFLREVERTGRGNLVVVASTAGLFGEAGHADYAAAKSALMFGLVRSLKNEIVRIAPLGRVNAVAPGWTVTPMARDAIADPSAVDRITRTMPLRKVGTPEDTAAQVVVLASDVLSGHVTGEVVTVAGGMEGRVLHG